MTWLKKWKKKKGYWRRDWFNIRPGLYRWGARQRSYWYAENSLVVVWRSTPDLHLQGMLTVPDELRDNIVLSFGTIDRIHCADPKLLNYRYWSIPIEKLKAPAHATDRAEWSNDWNTIRPGFYWIARKPIGDLEIKLWGPSMIPRAKPEPIKVYMEMRRGDIIVDLGNGRIKYRQDSSLSSLYFLPVLEGEK